VENVNVDLPVPDDRRPSAVFAVARNRVFLTYGRTNERFCLPSGVEVRYERLIHDHLLRHGYEVVVFFSNRGCFFLDPTSRDVVLASESREANSGGAGQTLPAAPGRAGKLLTHSTGLSLLRGAPRGAKPPLPVGRLRWADMANPTQMVPLMRRLLAEETRPTAIVFANDDIFATFARSELNQQFQALVKHEVKALPTGNRNLVIFNFPGSDPWQCLQTHRWGFLLGAGPESAIGIATPVYIGEPEADEVCHYLLSLHLKQGLALDAAAFPRLVQRLTSHLKASRQGLLALSPLAKASRLDEATVDRLTGAGRGADRPAREQLDALIGLQTFKDYVQGKLKSVARWRDQESPPAVSADLHRLVSPPPPRWIAGLRLHLVLTGNPGTGKTTVARLLGELYREAGVLPLGHTIKATRADLVAGYVGQTALKVRQVVQRALGGVLFIDEAYDLCRDPQDSFGLEAITALNEAMSDLNGQFAVVLAGYPKDMARLVKTNAGLTSRFDEVLHLDDYRPEELEAILRQALAAYPDLGLEEELEASLARLCFAIHANRKEAFGNARAMVQLAGTLYENMVRDDADRAGVRHLPARYQALLEQPAMTADGVLMELDNLIGLRSVKDQMRTLFNRLRMEQLRGSDGSRVTPGHLIFEGNPGTGKTTVARLLARQLQALRILPSNQVHSTTASQLIQGYVGQTTVATREFLQQGLGQVIFIDEAHQLAGDGGPGQHYGRDALKVLVPFAEDHRHECVIVLAGYPEPLRRLLDQDPGLASRFGERIVFEDYAPEEMVAIFDQMLRDAGVRWPAEACRDYMCEYFAALRQRLKRDFGNARTVRQEVEACRNRQADRLQREGRLDAADGAAREAAACLTPEDLPAL
jgi:SpoVK/Ycf46/Vps4 family AAA+-type ATPase